MQAARIIGRDQWIKTLVAPPHVTLLRAPASTGKRTVAQYVASRAGVSVADQLFYPPLEYRDEYGRPVERSDERAQSVTVYEPELTITHVRELISWSRTAPLSSPYKVAIVRLDHERADGTSWRASSRTLAAMLKLLEEPPATTRFMLLATRPTMPMIRSRAFELTAGLLTPEQVSEILYAVTDMTEHEARAAAALGGGRIAPSIAIRAAAEGSVQAVVDVLTSLAQRDQIALTEKARIWTDLDTEMLVRWAHERLTERWRVFAGSGAPQVSSSAAERVLRAVRSARGARPRMVLGAVAALAGK